MDQYEIGDRARSRGDCDDSPYDEIRQRLAARHALKKRTTPKPSDAIRAMRRVSERAAELLDNPFMLTLAGCVCVGLLLVMGLSPLRSTDPSALPPQVDSAGAPGAGSESIGPPGTDSIAVPDSVALLPPAQSSVNDAAENGPTHETALESPGVPTPAEVDSVPESGESFIVQVGSFRSPSNAERVAMSLREQSPDIPISVLAGRLHTVRAGPFPEMSAAVNSARSIEEAMGLLPLVIRLEAP